ncbi:MAG TPA: hypothetical protein VGH74_10045, partial [Planctomycetaceae bacterium]
MPKLLLIIAAALLIAVSLVVARCTALRADDGPNSQTAASLSEPLQSGLKVGEKVHTFYVRAITGPLKNKSVCYVCRNGDRPVVMFFVRRITPQLKKLLKG